MLRIYGALGIKEGIIYLERYRKHKQYLHNAVVFEDYSEAIN